MNANQKMCRLSLDKQSTSVSIPAVITPPDEDVLSLQRQAQNGYQCHALPAGNSEDGAPVHHDPWRQIILHTPVPTIILDAALCVIEISNSHLSLLGQPRVSLIGTSIYNIPIEAVPAPDIASLRDALTIAVTTKTVQCIENISVPKISDKLSLQIKPVFQESQLVNVMLETHGLTGALPQFSRDAHFREPCKAIVDAVTNYSILMLDMHGNIALSNSGASAISRCSESEIIGKHFSTFFRRDDCRAGKPEELLTLCVREGKWEGENWLYRPDDSRYWAYITLRPIYCFRQQMGFLQVVRDLTESKAAQTPKIATVKKTSKMQGNFLANVSHEIRTSMNSMNLALSLLADTSMNSQQQEYALIMQDSMSILLQLIDDVLDYSKLQTGLFPLTSESLSIQNITEAVVRSCRLLKPEIHISFSLAPGFPGFLKGDPLRYRQIVQNIVSNAVKFTERGYIKVNHTFFADEKYPHMYNIMMEVVDSGIGVPGDAVKSLFKPFSRFADSASGSYPGTGLGLSICKHLAEMMNGTVGYRPNPEGNGSTFWSVVRMGRAEDSPLSEHNSLSFMEQYDLRHVLAEVACGTRILLVDDDILNQAAMLRLLQHLGFSLVDTARNGAEAVNLVKRSPFSYDCILLDITMPVMDGLEAASQIRDIDTNVPLIALTGNVSKGTAVASLSKGMNDYITKPIHQKQLMQALVKLLKT